MLEGVLTERANGRLSGDKCKRCTKTLGAEACGKAYMAGRSIGTMHPTERPATIFLIQVLVYLNVKVPTTNRSDFQL